MLLLSAELLICGPQILALGGLEVFPRCFQKVDLEGNYGFVVDHVTREIRLTVCFLKQAINDQVARTDQHGVPGERRHRLIRRISVASRTEGQRLPPTLA